MNVFDRSAGDPAMRLLTAVFTPFRDDGSLALEAVEAQADELAARGTPAVYVGGTAGEGASLSTSERMALVERWCEAAGGRMDVIVHVGHSALVEARLLAAHAQESGAHAISAVPPYFHRPPDAEVLADFLAELTAAAPELPFIYYHIPGVTGVNLPAADVLVAAKERVPSFAGIKFAHHDLADFQRCLDLAGDTYDMYFGSARLLLAAIGVGAKTAIGSAYNFAAPIFLTMIEHVERGETQAARQCQFLAQSAIDTVMRYGGELAGFKAASGIVGVDCGPCRPPLRSPDAVQMAQLRGDLERLGLVS